MYIYGVVGVGSFHAFVSCKTIRETLLYTLLPYITYLLGPAFTHGISEKYVLQVLGAKIYKENEIKMTGKSFRVRRWYFSRV